VLRHDPNVDRFRLADVGVTLVVVQEDQGRVAEVPAREAKRVERVVRDARRLPLGRQLGFAPPPCQHVPQSVVCLHELGAPLCDENPEGEVLERWVAEGSDMDPQHRASGKRRHEVADDGTSKNTTGKDCQPTMARAFQVRVLCRRPAHQGRELVETRLDWEASHHVAILNGVIGRADGRAP